MNKEECIANLKFQIENCETYGHSDIYLDIDGAKDLLNFIKEHVELVEKFNWLKDCFSDETFNLIFTDKKSVEDWVERMIWHVKKCNELSSELRELKSNQPLKFEELHSGMWFYDNKKERFGMVNRTLINEFGEQIVLHYSGYESPQIYYSSRFEENRFFRKEVKENEHY